MAMTEHMGQVTDKSMAIAIDWGSTSFRAYHFSADGQLLEKRQADCGIGQVSGQSDASRHAWFERILFEHCADWLDQQSITPVAPILLSGMITSRNGWVETPYLSCPVKLHALTDNAVHKTVRDTTLMFLPGVAIGAGDDQNSTDVMRADVMRGEELQLIGATGSSTDTEKSAGLYVLPGTHSKWVDYNAGCLQSFHTAPTGELFATLMQHTLIGALSDKGEWDAAVFRKSVEQGYHSTQFLSGLFGARAGVLLEKIRPQAVSAYLSGLLIGREIREGINMVIVSGEAVVDTAITIIGEPILCRRYTDALSTLGFTSQIPENDMAADGFARLLALM